MLTLDSESRIINGPYSLRRHKICINFMPVHGGLELSALISSSYIVALNCTMTSSNWPIKMLNFMLI